MAFRLGEAFVEFKQRGLTSVKSSADQAARSLTGASSAARALSMALGAASVGTFAAKLIKLASDAEETQNRFDAVFKSQSDAVERWADNLAKEVGRARGDILSGLSSFQSFFVGMGFGADEAAEFSKQLQAASIDFASFNNMSDDEAMQRFIQAMSGSSEVLMKFGINVQEIQLQQELLQMGIKKSSSEITQQEKAMARLNIILRTMGQQGAMGDAVRTADSFANQLKRLQSNAKELGVSIGNELLPEVTKLLQQLNAIPEGKLGLIESAGQEGLFRIRPGSFLDRITGGAPTSEFAPGVPNLRRGFMPDGTPISRQQSAAAEDGNAIRMEQTLRNMSVDLFGSVQDLTPALQHASEVAGLFGENLMRAAQEAERDAQFAEQARQNQQKLDVLTGRITEQQARISDLMREGFTKAQAEQLAGQEKAIQELMGGDTMQAARRAQFTDARGINRLVQMAVSGEDMSKLQKDANKKLDHLNESNEQIAGSLKKGIKVEALPMG